jgi:hypothetical protein
MAVSWLQQSEPKYFLLQSRKTGRRVALTWFDLFRMEGTGPGSHGPVFVRGRLHGQSATGKTAVGKTRSSYWGLRSPLGRSRDTKRSTPPFLYSPNVVEVFSEIRIQNLA